MDNIKLVQSPSELPSNSYETIYLDTETTSGDKKKSSTNPWHHCDILGIAFVGGDDTQGYYIPVSHRHARGERVNINRDVVQKWVRDQLKNCKRWVNHNLKYDMHVLKNTLDVDPDCEVVDTLTLAKMVDSDWYKGYGLKKLSKLWAGMDIDQYEERLRPYFYYPSGHRFNYDYGSVLMEEMAEYGGMDTIANRNLYGWLLEHLPGECNRIWDIEKALTRVLYDVERAGIGIEEPEVRIMGINIVYAYEELRDEIKTKTGYSFDPTQNKDCYTHICIRMGYPVVEYTVDKFGNATDSPSFSKLALKQYLSVAKCPEDRETFKLMLKYREMRKLVEMYLDQWPDLAIKNRLHATYNQCVRTGRMSCSQPNMQQLSEEAKTLIIPHNGNVLLRMDFSQIEFRLIAHYIRNTEAINAYREDPDTDFHQWVADMCQIARKPAKNINFMLGYGGGKGKCIQMLSESDEIIDSIPEDVDPVHYCHDRALSVYGKYHAALPTLKMTMKQAEAAVYRNGFVRTLYGRRRRLPNKAAWRAFNTVNQASAADIMKDRTVAMAEYLKDKDADIVAIVHDEVLIEGPEEVIREEVGELRKIMENPPVKIRVPITASVGVSSKDWKECG